MSQHPHPRFSAYPFDEVQIARLTVYKAAVAAGFFRDTCAEAANAKLNVERLAAYKAAVQAGLYSDFSVEI